MPMLKTITAHNGCANIMRYLQKNGRAVTKDFQNICDKDNWAQEMDQTRVILDHNKGSNSVSYRHFIFSPDPWDSCSLTSLQSSATKWATTCFPGGQYAIIYHVDSGIPHAHIVLNASDLNSGNKVHISDPDVIFLAKAAQEIGRQNGLSPLPDLGVEEEAITTSEVRLSKTEQRFLSQRRRSWKMEIRDAVDVTAIQAVDLMSFKTLLENQFGIRTYDNRRGGLTFVHPDGMKATTKSLGEAYSPSEIRARLGNPSLTHRSSLPAPCPVLHKTPYYLRVEERGRAAGKRRTKELEQALLYINRAGIKDLQELRLKVLSLTEQANNIEQRIGESKASARVTFEGSRLIDRVKSHRDKDALRWLKGHGISESDYNRVSADAETIRASIASLEATAADTDQDLTLAATTYNTILSINSTAASRCRKSVPTTKTPRNSQRRPRQKRAYVPKAKDKRRANDEERKHAQSSQSRARNKDMRRIRAIEANKRRQQQSSAQQTNRQARKTKGR